MSNGAAARRSTLGEAERIDPALVSWIERNVAFPNSMVDRITPATSDIDRAWLSTEFGVADRWPVITEPFRQWVVEETFASEPPPLADLGVLFTSDVVPYEKLKLRLLNAGHSCLAYLSALLDIELVDQAMAEPVIHGYVKAFLDDEAGAVLPSVVGVDIDDYKQSLLTRFANPQIGDQISRLCLDGSAKFPKFLLPTVDALLEAGRSVDLSALALAGWCRYLMGRSESGLTIEPAGDPLLDRAIVKAKEADTEPRAFLGFEEVFPARLAQSPVFAEAFERSLTTLAHRGVRSAVDDALDRSTRTA